MKSNRLITFGCSYTYGMGLPDCYDVVTGKEGNVPSQQGWPSIVADVLNLIIINKGQCGASNLEILYEILNFDFEDNDTVVVMWTHHNRDLIFSKFKFQNLFKGCKLSQFTKSFRQLSVWQKDTVAINWQQRLNEYDYIQKSWIYVNHADLYLKSKNVKYIHYPATPEQFLNNTTLLKNIDLSNFYLYGFVVVDKGLDSHPGIESNRQTAKNIIKILKDVPITTKKYQSSLYTEKVRI